MCANHSQYQHDLASSYANQTAPLRGRNEVQSVCHLNWKYQQSSSQSAELSQGVELQIRLKVHRESQIILCLLVDGSPDIFSAVFVFCF